MRPALTRSIRAARALFGGALAWDAGDTLDPSAMAAAALGMGMPILIGVLVGHPGIGLAAAVGAMWVGNPPRGATLAEHLRMVRDIVLAAIGAAVAAALIARHGGWSDAMLVTTAGIAALLSGFSRPAAVASQRFIVFVTIGLGIAGHAQDRIALTILIAEGAVWAAFCALAIGVAARRFGIGPAVSTTPRSTAAFAHLRRRWLGTLRTAAGWAYALRLTISLGGAVLLRAAMPQHHYSWIAVAIALLTQRQSEGLVLRVGQRALGVATGVIATELIAAHPLPGWALVAVIGLLAALSPWLRTRSYVAYTAATTPLIMLVTSGGERIGQGLLLDRLVATLIAAILVVAAYLAARRWMAPPPIAATTQRQSI